MATGTGTILRRRCPVMRLLLHASQVVGTREMAGNAQSGATATLTAVVHGR
jgi:hypothetical protein